MQKFRKYTNEQLSRILSESANETLAAAYSAAYSSVSPWEEGKSCIEMAARCLAKGTLEGAGSKRGDGCRELYANAFDFNAKQLNKSDPDAVLRWLESRGMA